MYGWRGRIGLMVPSVNTTMETEFWAMAPRGVSVHCSRISGGREGTPEELKAMEGASLVSARDIAMANPSVVVFGCTSGSFYEGRDWNEEMSRRISGITGVPTVTTAGAMADCLVFNGHDSVSVVTPYVARTNERLEKFLLSHGVTVPRLSSFDMLDMFDHAAIRPEEIYRKAVESVTPKTQAIFIACTQLRALEVLDLLERDLGIPVYSAVQASAWQAYRVLRVDPQIRGKGSLLAKLSAADM